MQTTRTRDNSISSSQFVWKKNAHNYSDSQLFRLTIIIIPLLQLCWNFPRQAFIGNLLVAKILEKKIMISFFSPIYWNFLLAVAFSIKYWFSIYKPIYPCATVLYHSERRTISFLDFSDILIVETLEGFRFYISCCISALKKKKKSYLSWKNARRVMFDILLVVIFRKKIFSFWFHPVSAIAFLWFLLQFRFMYAYKVFRSHQSSVFYVLMLRHCKYMAYK